MYRTIKTDKKTKTNKDWRLVALSIIVLGAFVFNYFFDINLRHKAMLASAVLGDKQLSEEEQQAALAFLKFKAIKQATIPFGVPVVYGRELNVNYDQVQESMNTMRVMGPTYGAEGQKIILTGDKLRRYIDIGQRTACEFCCSALSLVKDDGSAACGCAHSTVMRGLAAYLLQNHADQFTNDEILAEVNNWKKTFFPKQTLMAVFGELEKSGDKDVVALLREFPDFLPSMVGGC